MLLLVLTLLLGTPAYADDPVAAWATVQQDVLPTLVARKQSADARIAAREAFFRGEAELSAAFPHLVTRDLCEPAVVRGALALLDDVDGQRAVERTTATAELTDAQQRRLTAQRDATLDAEDRASALERRLLLGVQELLRRRPELTRARLDVVGAPWRNRVTAARTLPDTASDEDRAAAARDAAAADAEIAALATLVADLRRAALISGAPVPSPDADLALLGGDRAEAASSRLVLLRPALAPDRATAVSEALATSLRTRRLPAAQAHLAAATEARQTAETNPVDRPVDVLQTELEQAQSTLAATEATLAAITARGPLANAQRELAGIDHQAAQLVQEAAALRLKRAQERDAAREKREKEAAEAQRRAADAQVAADQALAEATGQREIARAQLLNGSAQAQTRTSKLVDTARVAEQSALDSRKARHDRVDALQERAQAARVRMLGEEAVTPDAVATELRTATTELRSEFEAAWKGEAEAATALATAREAIAADRDRIALATAEYDVDNDPALAQAMAAWDVALTDGETAAVGARDAARADADDVYRELRLLKRLRRELQGWTSSPAAIQERGYLLQDLRWELALAPRSTWVAMRDRLSDLRDLSNLDFNVLRNAVLGSFWAIAVLGIWWWVRRQSLGLGQQLVHRLADSLEALREEDAQPLVAPIAGAVRTALDLIVGWLLMSPIEAVAFELSVAVRVYLHLALYRFILAIFDVAVNRYPQVRPALLTLQPELYRMTRRTLRTALVWYLGWRVLHIALTEVLAVDALAVIAGGVVLVAGVVAILVLLYAWEPVLRATLSRRSTANRVVAWLQREPGNRLARIPRAAVSSAFLTVSLALEVLPRLAREGTRLGQLFNMVSRMQIGTTRDEELPEPVEAKLLAPMLTREGPWVPRPGVQQKLADGMAAWRDGERGLIAVVGDRGDGKHREIDLWLSTITDAQVTRSQLTHRITTEAGVVAWLSEVTGGTGGSAEELAAAVSALPAQVFVLEEIHNAFLRAVHGFHGFRALLYVLNATCDRHLWVTTAHRPAWRYLGRLGDLVALEVYRTTIDLPPCGEAQLRELTLARAEKAGFRCDFSGIVRTSLLGGDAEGEVARTQSVFYRLLAEASDGNPAVALRMFTWCLVPTDWPDLLRVKMHPAVAGGVITGLGDSDLFTLVALRTQEQLDERELTEVTNLSPGRVRSVVKHLQGRGLLARRGDRVCIDIDELALVSRTLKRRHFLQGAG